MSFFRINDSKEIHVKIERPNQSSKIITPIHIESKTEFIQTYFQTLNAGNIPFVLNPKIPKEIALSLLPEDKVAKKPGHYICTSGTTSATPKRFFFNIKSVNLNALAHNESLGLYSPKNILFPLPFTHSFGVVVGMWASMVGNHTCFFSERTMGINELVDNFDSKDLVYLTPSLVRQILKYARSRKTPFPQPEKISIGSSILHPEEAKGMMELFPESSIYYTYGLTEMGPRVSTLKISDPTQINLGTPIKGVKWSRENGILYVQSPYRAENIDSSFNTNDLVDESFKILGRDDDTIIYQGRNIYPSEIENLLTDYSDCALLGLPNKLHGEVPVLVFEGEHEEEPIWDILKKHLPQDYLPKRIYFNTTLPRTSMGKIKKKEIVELLCKA